MDRKRILDKLQGQKLKTASATYQLTRELGRGGNGVALLCTDGSSEVVAKLYIPPDHRDLDDRALERFRNEIAITSKLHHPHIIKALDTATLEIGTYRLPFYIMPLASGTLRSEIRVETDPNAIERKFRLFSRAAQGVAFLHHNGIIHRDLKPENILLDRAGNPLVADLGIAHVNPDFVTVGLRTIASEKLLNRDYYAPEQRFGSAKEIDHRADIYALGCILYELVSGIPPVRVSIPDLKVISAVLVPFDPVWRRMTEWEPERRYQSVDEALEDAWMACGTVLATLRGAAGVRHPDLQRMMKLLRSSNALHRQSGIDLATRLGKPALPELHSLLGHARRDVRNATAIAPGRIGDPESIPFLVAGLYGNSERAVQFRPVIDAAAEALGEYPSELRARAVRMISQPVRPHQVLALLKGLATDEAYTFVLQLNEHQRLLLDWAETHVEMLREIDEERAWPAVVELIKSGDDLHMRVIIRKLSAARNADAVALWASRPVKYNWYLQDQIEAVSQLPADDSRRKELLGTLEERVQQSRTNYQNREQLLQMIKAMRRTSA